MKQLFSNQIVGHYQYANLKKTHEVILNTESRG